MGSRSVRESVARRASRASTVRALVALWLGCGASAQETRFRDATEATGIRAQGMSFGAAWGDWNGDGHPDLYLTRHYYRAGASFYTNRGDGSFEDTTSAVFQTKSDRHGDKHGAVFADLDNDGDQDLAVATGADFGHGSQPAKLFVNDHGRTADSSERVGLANPLARGRTSLPVDLDRDGLLDLVATAFARPDGRSPTTVFLQRPTEEAIAFVTAPDEWQLSPSHSNYAQLTHVAEGPALWLHGYPPRLYAVKADGVTELRRLLPKINSLVDSAWADFDGDGNLDLFCVTAKAGSQFAEPEPGRLEISLDTRADEKGVRFRTAADQSSIQVVLSGRQLPLQSVHLGAQGHHPDDRSFVLDAADPAVHGIEPHDPGSDKGLWVGFDPEAETWHLFASSGSQMRTNLVVTSPARYREIRAEGFDPPTEGRNHLYLWRQDRFLDSSREARLTDTTHGISVVAADFDNDMDVDLYVVQNDPVSNLPNVYYENDGTARFTTHPTGSGAPGSTAGRGESATVADIDGDGFLDLCVTNGEGNPPFCDDGPLEFYNGRDNGNHWLEIDLVGRVSNRDGIGARVVLEAGGHSQVRMQDAGVHRFAQNHGRLHFGLGSYESAAHVTVHWPSGEVQRIEEVDANQVLEITEPRQGRPR